MMNKPCALLLLGAAALAGPVSARAQNVGPYLGASFSYAALEEPFESDLRLAFDPVLSVGFAFSARHVVELSASHIAAEQKEVWHLSGPGETAEAPYTIGFAATPVTLSYRHRMPIGEGKVQPFADFGMVWARVVDSFQSDTPREQRTTDLLGASVQLGAQWAVTQRVSLLASVGYRRFDDDDGRPARAFELDGSTARMGLQFHF
jgi:opacity protein-like surface antigen